MLEWSIDILKIFLCGHWGKQRVLTNNYAYFMCTSMCSNCHQSAYYSRNTDVMMDVCVINLYFLHMRLGTCLVGLAVCRQVWLHLVLYELFSFAGFCPFVNL